MQSQARRNGLIVVSNRPPFVLSKSEAGTYTSRSVRRLRRSIRKQDICWWANSFLRAAIAKDPSAFPLPADYVPRKDITVIPY